MAATPRATQRNHIQFENIRNDLDKLRLSASLTPDHAKWRNSIKPSRHVAESNPRFQGKKDVKLDSSSIVVFQSDKSIG